MYGKILVPLDTSQLAECALDHVMAIGTGCRVAEVHLLYVVAPVSPLATAAYPAGVEALERMKQSGEEYLARIAAGLQKEGLETTTAVLEGKPADTVLDYAVENGVDLIILSTHGRSGPSRWAFGSVADEIVRRSTVAVLIAVPKACRVVGE